MQNVFEELNEEQILAVQHLFGPAYITAGPGSGKSRVIVRKIAYAIQNGVAPEQIILFTFTNRAAKEIKERVEDFVGEQARHMTIGTYHSVCVRLLRRYASYLGYEQHFTILDSEDSFNIIAELCKTKNHNLNARAIAHYISDQKRRLVPYQTALSQAVNSLECARAEIYRDYERRLKVQNSVDFDDLILLTIQLLQKHPEVQAKIHQRYQMILSDESHDSSTADLELIRLLLNDQQNLTMIFDVDQSIYSFRGADIYSVMAFKKQFENLQEFVLNRNYRSTQTIVDASSSLIQKNPILVDKHLYSKNEIGDKIIYFEEQTAAGEAERLVQFIRYMHGPKYNVDYHNIAILYRTNQQGFEIEKALLKYSLPYELTGRVSFYARKEIKDLISYLRFAFNPYDYEAFKRIINVPKRNIGTANLQKLYDYICGVDADILTALQSRPQILLTKKTNQNLDAFLEIIQTLRTAYLFAAPDTAFQYLIEAIDYQAYLSQDENFESRWSNVEQLIELASSFMNVEELLEQASLQNVETPEATSKIAVMTMHASKGLEWDCVFIAGCNEEYCPFAKAIEANNIDEERRLFYVAMTRAKQYLFLSRSRSTLQSGHYKYLKESRFIKEIASQYIFKMPPQTK